ncbi:hypothetical protein SCP_0305270 [Sparassis crispa]|uniref:FAD linked oxidase N-terminal domain-containing protein n=1 Tax=Sparassis crispa TaxID=139825 RepID=A0A401GF45_9APHY|nr:hypothetical protein SCP_0305270 [Sparassis crispa]GBE80807.1 hypothetical protein SCP_0305270 [Sparassis crispa]
MAPPSLSIPPSHFPQHIFNELSVAVRGPVCSRYSSEYVCSSMTKLLFMNMFHRFAERSRTFNGKLNSTSRIVVSPLDAEDVSTVVRFCTQHGLSLSVRAGGYGIAGWSVAGDVIVDLSMLKEVDIEAPKADAEGGKDWTRLADMPPPGSKGKGHVDAVPIKFSGVDIASTAAPLPSASQDTKAMQISTATAVKRRRGAHDDTPPDMDEERKRNRLGSYDAASQAVASFLRGPPLPYEAGEKPRDPPVDRGMLHGPASVEPGIPAEPEKEDEPHLPVLDANSRQVSTTLSSSTGSESGADHTSPSRSSIGTAATTPPSGSPDLPSTNTPTFRGAEPFGYITSGFTFTERPPVYSSAHPLGFVSGLSSGVSNVTAWRSSGQWGGVGVIPSVSTRGLGSIPSAFAFPSGATRHLGNLTPARPVHPHAYLTFGAGMLQKELDMYTADHPLEGISGVTGAQEDRLMPYHIPS